MLKLDWNLLFTAINIVVWYIIIKLFLFKPVNNIIAKRREAINGKFNEAETAKKDAYALKAKYEEAVSNASNERQNIIEKARLTADEEYKRILEEADVKAGAVINNAKEQAKEEHQKIIREADMEIARLVMEATTKLMLDSSNGANDKHLYDEFITKEGEHSES